MASPDSLLVDPGLRPALALAPPLLLFLVFSECFSVVIVCGPIRDLWLYPRDQNLLCLVQIQSIGLWCLGGSYSNRIPVRVTARLFDNPWDRLSRLSHPTKCCLVLGNTSHAHLG